MNIILIGYRCTGKTSVGKKLAEKVAVPFYDTDALIVNRIGKTIKEWVEEKGWPSFRQAEKEVIKEMASLKSAVIALGGGAVLDLENREIIKKNGLILWLTADVPTIIERMNADPHNMDTRPHLSEEDWESEVQATLAERFSLYEQMANVVIDTKGKTVENIIKEVCNFIKFEDANREHKD